VKEQYKAAGLAALQLVLSQLQIQSSNRKDDNRDDGFMIPLGKRKSDLSDRRMEEKAAEKLALETDLNPLQLQAQTLLSDQRKIGMETNNSKLSEEARTKLTAQLRSLTETRKLLLAQIGQLERKIKANETTTEEEDIEITAQAAADSGRGNCDEMSALAYLFLRSTVIRPIDLVCTNANSEEDQHQFVVIGRGGTDPLDDPGSWSEGAAICDVWDQAVYEPAALKTRLMKLGYPSKLFLCAREDR
jgi:hypothetical protein